MTQEDAQRHGVKLMLSGWGGDEAVSFNARGLASEYLLKGNWRGLAEYSRIGYALKHPARIPGTALRFWEKAVVPALPDTLYHNLAYKGRRLRDWRVSYINPDFESLMRSQIRSIGRTAREVPGVKANQHILYYNGHMTARMESWASFGADRGISYAYPLTNRRVMEFAYGLPGWVHYQETWARYLYRYTMARIFPPNVTWDSVKVDGTLNRRVLKRKSKEEMTELRKWLEENRLGEPNPWVNVPKLREVLLSEDNTPRRSGGSEISKAMQCLTMWRNWRK
jgi:asparagine synthase (glutamine-hydrolysing)